jgi:hypothetical protein
MVINMVFEVGKVSHEFIGHKEDVLFDIDDSGALLLVFFNNPSANEIAQFNENARFEMRLTDFTDVTIFTFKLGSLNWMDTPYTPHLSKNLTRLENVTDDMGYAMTIVLINGVAGKVESLRLISLSTGMSRRIKKSVDVHLERP